MLAGLIFCVLPGFPCAIYHSHVGESDRLQSKESQSYKSHYNTPNSVPHKEGTLRECGTFIDVKLLRISNVWDPWLSAIFAARSKLENNEGTAVTILQKINEKNSFKKSRDWRVRHFFYSWISEDMQLFFNSDFRLVIKIITSCAYHSSQTDERQRVWILRGKK